MYKSIAAIDLRPVVEAVTKQKLMKRKDLKVGEELYRLFLFLRKRYPKLELVPLPLADIFWHQHILMTRKYHADCKKMFGRYLHHEPGTPENEAQMKKAKALTLKLIQKHFGE